MPHFKASYIFVFLIIVMCAFIYEYISWTKRVSFKTGTNTDGSSYNHQWADISDIFVPRGQHYNNKEGIIYDCFAGPYKTVNAPTKTNDLNSKTLRRNAGENSISRHNSFKQIFEKRIWHGGREGGNMKTKNFQASGGGSSLQAAQTPLALLNSLIDRLKIFYNKQVITLVDIPCGDFFWIRELVGRRSDVQYTGIDIVPAIIENHQKTYSSLKNARFENKDIVESGLNQSYDIILCRDMLQHLTNADVMKVLVHFSTSGSKLLVTTNKFIEKNKEVDTKGGRHRALNLMLAPMNLVPPLCSMQDNAKDLSVWKLPLKQSN